MTSLQIEDGWWYDPATVQPRRTRQVTVSEHIDPRKVWVTGTEVIAHPTIAQQLVHPANPLMQLDVARARMRLDIDHAFAAATTRVVDADRVAA